MVHFEGVVTCPENEKVAQVRCGIFCKRRASTWSLWNELLFKRQKALGTLFPICIIITTLKLVFQSFLWQLLEDIGI